MTSHPTAVVLILLLAACQGGTDALGPGSQLQETEGQWSSATVAGQQDAIADIVEARAAAWIDKDAAAYAASFHDDATFINPLGGFYQGSALVASQHAFLFAGPFSTSAQTESIQEITFLTGTSALVRLEATLTGYVGLPPGLAEVQPGVVRTRITWLVVKRAGEWGVQHQHMTAVQPGA